MGLDFSVRKLDTYGFGETAEWGKSNQIFNWFISNCKPVVQNQVHEVNQSELILLWTFCEKALEYMQKGDIESAKELLPDPIGFSFGPREIEETDIKNTISNLEYLIINSTIDSKFIFESDF